MQMKRSIDCLKGRNQWMVITEGGDWCGCAVSRVSVDLHPHDSLITRKWYVSHCHPPFTQSVMPVMGKWRGGRWQLGGWLTQLPTPQTHDSCDRFPAPPSLPPPCRFPPKVGRQTDVGTAAAAAPGLDMSGSGLSNVSALCKGPKVVLDSRIALNPGL